MIGKSYLQESRCANEDRETIDKVAQVSIHILQTSNLYVSLKHCYHAIPVLSEELSRLEECLIVLRAS